MGRFTALALLLAAVPACTGTAGKDLSGWILETGPGGRVHIDQGVIDIDVPGGTTLWLDQPLQAPVRIEYEIMAVDEGGDNDRVSDVNAFWMATNADGSSPLGRRNGTFAQYDTLKTYYVGIGGNYNSTTRMRRYIGKTDDRPLRPEHDLGDEAVLLKPNQWQTITLIADGRGAEVHRNGERLFRFDDDAPYTHGWFAIRTVWSHLRVRKLKISEP